MKYVAFDLEISKEIREGCEDWRSLRPLGISCAATYDSTGNLTIWQPQKPRDSNASYASKMSEVECGELANYLYKKHELGYEVITWNGLGFDFDVLCEEVCFPTKERVIELALDHIDVAFAMLCAKGYMIGLNTAAQGMNLPGKTDGMSGALAPAMWQQGREAQEKVLEYVGQDAIVTANVYDAITRKQVLYWISRSGRYSYWRVRKVLRVNEALKTPEPDTSWMTDPWTREKFVGWIEERR